MTDYNCVGTPLTDIPEATPETDVTDKDMVELVCEAIQFRGLARSNDASDWGVHQAQCDWVRAMQKQNEALKEMVAAQKERIEALSRIHTRYSGLE